jgi:Tfp pilus assembly protein PilO
MTHRILPIVALLIAGGLFFGYVHPTYTGKVATLSQEIQTLDGALSAAKRFQAKESELAAEKAQLPAEQLARLETYLPDGVDNVQLILDLNALAARSGLALSDFNVEDAGAPQPNAPESSRGPLSLQSATPTESLNLSLKATGTYAALRTFLAGVETSLRPLDLVDITLVDSTTGVYTYQMTFRFYWLR